MPTTLCKLIFELVVYGEPATSNAAWNLLNYLIKHPVDIGFWDGLKSKSDLEQSARAGIACGLEWFPSDTFFVEVRCSGHDQESVMLLAFQWCTSTCTARIRVNPNLLHVSRPMQNCQDMREVRCTLRIYFYVSSKCCGQGYQRSPKCGSLPAFL